MQQLIPSAAQCIAIVSFDDRADAYLYNAAFALLYGCGMFNSEVLDLKRGDVAISHRTLLTVLGTRARTLPVPKGASERLSILMQQDAECGDDEFVFRRGRRQLDGPSVAAELKRRSAILGIRRPLVTTDLRRAFASHMAAGQVPAEVIAAMMGYDGVNSLDRLLMRPAA